jgi:IS1 family transposase
MNVLPRDKQIEIVAALVEGCSIRSIERLTGVHRDTIMRLGVQVGVGCAALHDRMMRDLQVQRVEIDEIWSYVGKKQRHVKPGETDKGDQYVFVALAGAAKAIVGYRTGKRNRIDTRAFVVDLWERVLGAPEISSDAFMQYPNAVDLAFGSDCTYGTIDKRYEYKPARGAARRYSPGKVVGVKRAPVIGVPKHISTSYVERQNLTLRMQQRRFSRLTNAFSKKLENHCAAVSLYVAHYNLCRVHEALRLTPAMHVGVADHIWTIAELVEAALSSGDAEPSGRRYGRFTVIDGGLS